MRQKRSLLTRSNLLTLYSADGIAASGQREAIDQLCELGENGKLKESLLKEVETRLVHARAIEKFVNNRVAHSASPQSREQVSTDDLEISLKKLNDATKGLIEVFGFMTLVAGGYYLASMIPMMGPTAFTGLSPSEVSQKETNFSLVETESNQWYKFGWEMFATYGGDKINEQALLFLR